MTISVIMPVYNGADFIGEALQSILMQTQPVQEIIVINDGSTDNLDEALDPFLTSITLINQSNAGQAAARNKGIRLAKSELIAFLDADDYWKNNHIELLCNKLKNDSSLDYVIGRVKNFKQDCSISEGLENPNDGLAGFVPGAGLFHRSCFERVGLFDESYRLAEVVDWSSRAMDGLLKFEIVEAITLMRRIHGNNNGIKKAALKKEYLRAIRTSLKRREAKK